MEKLTRREFMKTTVKVGGWALAGSAAPGFLKYARAEEKQGEYLKAKINWRQVDGEKIKILVTPAHYFSKFRAVSVHFTELTGIKVEFEVIPPRENREKAVLDLGAKTANYATHTADPMYLSLYEANHWIDPLDDYLNDPKLTDKNWFNLMDIIPLWRAADSVKGKLYGMPVEGEATIHIYRKDICEKLGIKPPETLEEFREAAKKANKFDGKMAGAALRGFRGAGQNVYIWPSLFLEFGGKWFDDKGKPQVNSEAGVKALEYYCDLLQNYGPPGVENMNWPEIMEAFAGGNIFQYIDANSTASIIEDKRKSKVAGLIGYQRWPKGPTGRRVTSIWNWTCPINAALSKKKKVATWLYLQWLASRPTQFSSAVYKETPEAVVRTGVNRLSIWSDAEYRKVIGYTPNYADVVLRSMREDTDADWRPRVPEWPKIGEAMAVAIQSALVKQTTPKKALDEANQNISTIMGK
ncbi:MAG TPA: sugar ABC transporter substrate-binding protein [Thermodesulfobacteriota bacterium]|nr:sugar ABC transporter substrate-binding protein [Thermodesulfobacteriota bacterium]